MTENPLMGSKAAATTHPQEPRATLAAWMVQGGAQGSTQSFGDIKPGDIARWHADLDNRLGHVELVPRKRSRWQRFMAWLRK